MRKNLIPAVVVVLAIGGAIAHLAQPLRAQNVFTGPEWVVKDSVGTVVGGFSMFAFRGQNEVSFHNQYPQ